MPSTHESQWMCSHCKADKGIVVRLEIVEHEVSCPRCFKVDLAATSSINHVDLSETTGQIVDPLQALQTLDKEWVNDANYYERQFAAKVEDMIRTLLSEVFRAPDYNFPDAARRWFKLIRQSDKELRDLDHLVVSLTSKRLPYLVALAVRLAVQESNLISIYNRLRGNRQPPTRAVQGYSKGDDRVFSMTVKDLFAKAQERLDLNNPARPTFLPSFQDYDRQYTDALGTELSFCDETLLCVSQALVILHSLVQATPEERQIMLRSKQTRKGWPDETFDQYKKIKDWDDIIRIADGLLNAQACVAIFSESGRSCGAPAVALVGVASQIVLGRAATNFNMVTEELRRHFGVHTQSVGRRTAELNRLVLAWSTSIPEAGLPLPRLKPPKRSTRVGQGLQGWGSDKRRQVPVAAIVPRAGRTIAENWQAIKRARLRRSAVIPYQEEMTLTRKMFTGSPVNAELAALLRQYTPSDAGSSRLASPSASDTQSGPSRRARSDTPLIDIHEERTRSAALQQSVLPVRPASKLDAVRDWIEQGDDSSDDDGGSSTDSEEPEPRFWKKSKTTDSRQTIGELPRPFAFSIGPNGFGIDRSAPIVSPKDFAGSSSSLLIPSLTRGRSVESGRSSGLTSASEACRMSRQPSSSDSIASSSTASTSTLVAPRSAYRATPLRSLESPTPSSVSDTDVVSRAAELAALERGRTDDSDHHGVLIREREQLAYKDLRDNSTLMMTRDRPDEVVIKAIKAWLDQPQYARQVPERVTAALLDREGVPLGRPASEMAAYLASHCATRSRLETLLRLGLGPDDIPNHLAPQSSTSVNVDLYHYVDRDAIVGIGDVDETEALKENSLRIFFRGVGNDTLPETFLNEEEVEERIKSYYRKAYWEDLDDPSPVRAATKKRQRKPRKAPKTSVPENMIQLFAAGYDGNPDLFKNDPEGETDLIQRASLARLLHYEQRPPWDPFKVTASVPSIWYNDGIAELRLIPGFKNTIQAADELAGRVLRQQVEDGAERSEEETESGILD